MSPEHKENEKTDSAGQPWAGRRLEPRAEPADDGSADPGLLAALTRFAAGGATAVDVVEAVRTARLLVALVAEAGDVGMAPGGHLVDKTQELSIVTVQAQNGRRVLPAFTSVDTMRAWNPKARPVPAAGPRVALAAASENTELVVIDPVNPTELVLRRPAVRALATGAPWTPPHLDPAVQRAFASSIEGEADAVGIAVENGDPSGRMRADELLVRLALLPGLDQAALESAIARITARWAASAVIADGVDSLALRLESATENRP